MIMNRLPASGPAREALRQKGQFWTPDWVANAMVSYALNGGAKALFDPAVGAGAFFSAARRLNNGLRLIDLHGSELHEAALMNARQNGLTQDDLAGVDLGDFLEQRFTRTFPAIVANPPYMRHHRLSARMKERLRHYAIQRLGFALDGRAGLHVYFLLRALELLDPGGRLAFIVPADICEGVFARPLWNWIIAHYRLEAAITFAPEATPFPGVDTNPLIVCISRNLHEPHFTWARINEPSPDDLPEWFAHGFARSVPQKVACVRREVSEAVVTGLSRPPFSAQAEGCRLGNLARVMRGIATGDNEFFLFTNERRKEAGLEKHWFKRIVGRTRDCPDGVFDEDTLAELEAKGRPTWLLSLGSSPIESLPAPLREYLKQGEKSGLPQRPLIGTRKPWFKMEQREVPPILFAYLGRRNTRFVLNRANVYPLTGFLCVYPDPKRITNPELLWRVLNHPSTLDNLRFVGKSYGDGAIKVEPRNLEELIIPSLVMEEFGLREPEIHEQLALLEQSTIKGFPSKVSTQSAKYRLRKTRW